MGGGDAGIDHITFCVNKNNSPKRAWLSISLFSLSR